MRIKKGLQGKFEDVGRNFIKTYRMEICQLFDFYPTELWIIKCLTEVKSDNHKVFMFFGGHEEKSL